MPKANGVLLEDGKFIECDYILSNCTPHITFNKLLGNYELEKSLNKTVSTFFKRINTIDYESGTMKINLAVKRLPNFLADPNKDSNIPMPHHQCTIHLNCENIQLIDDAYKNAKLNSILNSKPMIEMVIPSVLDNTLAPKGCHVILLFCQYFPMSKTSESNEIDKERFSQIVFNSIESYAPGFKDSILFKDVLTPFELEKVFGLTGGNIFHGAMSLNQLFVSRPLNGWCSYNSPIENLYLAGSGAHPGGGVMGSPGRLAALELINKLSN
jgi:phytoene dehydrogenase-like protein